MAQLGVLDSIERADNLSERAAGRIRDHILSHGLKPGDRLPTERSLAEQLGVSRTVVREAVKSLQAKGLVSVQTGSGTYVAEVTPGSVSDLWELALYTQSDEERERKLQEMRRVVEVEIAVLAAARATAESIAELAILLVRQKASLGDKAAYVQADLDFHQALARATQNECFGLVVAPLTDLLLEAHSRSYDTPGLAERGLGEHERILRAVAAHDVEGARRAMGEHLNRDKLPQGTLEMSRRVANVSEHRCTG